MNIIVTLAPTSYLLIGQKESAFRFVPSEQTNLALNLKSSTTISMLAFNILTNRLYWLEANLKNTIKYLYNNVAHTLDLQKTDADPQSFTIDFFSNVLYWTDGSDSSISFVHLVYPSKHGVIFKNERFRPIKITSIPEKGYAVFHIQFSFMLHISCFCLRPEYFPASCPSLPRAITATNAAIAY